MYRTTAQQSVLAGAGAIALLVIIVLQVLKRRNTPTFATKPVRLYSAMEDAEPAAEMTATDGA